MKEKIKRTLCLVLCMLMASSVSACELLFEEFPFSDYSNIFGESSSTDSNEEKESNEENSSNTFNDDLSDSNDSSSSSNDSSSSSNDNSSDSNDNSSDSNDNSSDSNNNSSDSNDSSSGSNDNSSDSNDSSSGSNDDSSDSEVELPPTTDPDPEKELLKLEIDSLGHEIAYYTDGSWEDLGRVTPIDFTPEAPTERLGYQTLLKEPKADALGAFYLAVYEQSKNFFHSTTDVALDKYEYYSLPALNTKSYNLTMDELTSVWGTVKQDYPEFYWLSNGIYSLGDEFYVCVDAEYAEGAERKKVQAAIEKATLECDAYINGVMSEAERALIVHDYIAAEISYAYESDGVTPADAAWAHNITGWALYDSGVCETYAETFTYLCNLFEVESSVVIGVAAEVGVMGNHAWNILQLDNEWYAVDVTWDDGFANNGQKLVTREWFGVPATEFRRTHSPYTPANGWGIYYQFALPTLSEKGLSPVLFGEKGGALSWIISIDEAFSKMTKTGGRYEITLYPSSKVLEDKGTILYPEGARFSSPLPKVAELTIKGNFVYTDKLAGYGYMPKLEAVNAVVLNGNVTLDCIYLYAPSFTEGSHKVTYKNNATVYLRQIIQG